MDPIILMAVVTQAAEAVHLQDLVVVPQAMEEDIHRGADIQAEEAPQAMEEDIPAEEITAAEDIIINPRLHPITKYSLRRLIFRGQFYPVLWGQFLRTLLYSRELDMGLL